MTMLEAADTRAGAEARLLYELEPVVAENLDRHLRVAKTWHPHDYVPWSQGRDFAFLGGTDWRPEDSPLDPVARTAMTVNLLTEDNLPSYHREIATRFGRDGAWGEWVGRWTAEEGRHGIALRDYLVVTRGVDPVELENLRMVHMQAGYDSGDKSALQTVAYVSFQELATRVSHRNTGAGDGMPAGRATAGPHRHRREPAHGLLPQPRGGGTGPRPGCHHGRDPGRGGVLPDAGAGHARLRPQLGDHRQGRDLRPPPAPRRGHLRRCCGSGRSSTARTSAPWANRRARSWPRSCPRSTSRRRASSSGANVSAPAQPAEPRPLLAARRSCVAGGPRSARR